MTANDTVTIFDPDSGQEHTYPAHKVRDVAIQQLGMVQGPFELTLFTRNLLVTAIKGIQSDRLTALRDAMTANSPDFRAKIAELGEVETLLQQLGIEIAPEPPAPSATAPIKGDQMGLLEDQGALPWDQPGSLNVLG